MLANIIAYTLKYLAAAIIIVFIVLLVKRIFTRSEKELETVPGNIVKKGSKEIIKEVLSLYLINRLVLFVFVYLYVMITENRYEGFFKIFKYIWLKWDSNGYLRIAKNWYSTVGDEKYDIAFYPLYPILVKIGSFLFKDYFISGFIISNMLLILAMYFLYKLVLMDFEVKIASDTVKYVLIFPFSFFFSIVYTESLFLFLSIMTIYFARKKIWLWTGIFGMLAAFSRNQGLLLAIPLLLEVLSELNLKANLALRNYTFIIKRILLSICVTLLVPYGTFLYLLVNKTCYGDWFKFLEYQNENWSNRLGFFAENIKKFCMEITYRDVKLCLGVFLPNIVLFFLCALLLVYSHKKLRLSYLLYGAAYLLISFSPTWLLSGPRYITGMFPLYLMLATAVKSDKVRSSVGSIMYVLLVFYAVLFFMNGVL